MPGIGRDDGSHGRLVIQIVSLIGGAAAFAFVGWRYNVPIAAWVAPLLLMRFFRDSDRWYATLPAIPLLAAASYIQIAGAWDLDPLQQYLIPFLRPAIVVAALYADRALLRRLPSSLATLVFPAVYTGLDFAFSFTPFGTVFSISATQFGVPAVAQLASLTAIWGIGFLIGWTASVANLLWERRTRLRDAGATPFVFGGILLLVLAYGEARSALVRPASQTVRVASITVSHPRDYWNWIDEETPRILVEQHTRELLAIEDRLFAQSTKAVEAGSKIVFWSEGNMIVTPENREKFSHRAAAFARDNGVYLATAQLDLHYGLSLGTNRVVMYAPDGSEGFSYEKTKSWYPTGSDGLLPTLDTPYGRIGSAICFDMDFPAFINALGRSGADIVLVPSYDSAGIRPFHSEVGLMRAIENGFSVVRQTNEGSSMAVDGVGHLLSRQEYFETADPIMFSDLPTKRVNPIDRWAGDWFAYASAAAALVLILFGIFARRRVADAPQAATPRRRGRPPEHSTTDSLL